MNRKVLITALLLGLAFTVTGCEGLPPGPTGTPDGEPLEARGIAPGAATRIDITASFTGDEHLFSLSSHEVSQGWTTFRFTNASPSDHFVLLFRAPQAAIVAAESAGQSLRDHWHETVTVPFQSAFDPYIAGEMGYEEFLGDLVGAISGTAPWFLDPGATTVGGPGLTAAGGSSETTVRLEPGTYILECYVKDGDEEFHSFNGMLQMLTVTDDASGAREPSATSEVRISSSAGIEIPGEIRPGLHTFVIDFLDQQPYEHLQGHNAHLVRLSGTDAGLLADLAAWMDWRQEGALAHRPPAGVVFLGGTMEMQAGGKAYHTVNLTPGDYAWIAEVPDPGAKGMLETFTVPGGPR